MSTDDKRSILFPTDYPGKRFQNTGFPFFNLKDKYHSDYDVAMKHLKEEFEFVKG